MHGDIIVEFNIDPLKIAGAIWSQKYHSFTAGIILGPSRYPWKSVLYLRWPCFHCEGNPAETKRRQRGGGGEGEQDLKKMQFKSEHKPSVI